MPFTAEQYFTISPPAFLWKAVFHMAPLLSVSGRQLPLAVLQHAAQAERPRVLSWIGEGEAAGLLATSRDAYLLAP